MNETQENKQSKPGPFFVCEHPALDFLSTVASPWGEEIEWIESGADLIAWLGKAELISSDIALHFEKNYDPETLNDVAGQARDLREWFRTFVVSHTGHPLEHSALEELGKLNSILATDYRFNQIGTNGPGHVLCWRQERRWNVPKDLLQPIADIMGDLVCGADFSHIKNCEGPTCSLYFLDVSKNHKRRWCSMSVCGNRAKAAAHRARKKKSFPRK